MIHLRPQDAEAIIRIANETLPKNTQLLVYGSRINGTSHDTSDLDLAIKTLDEQPLPFEQFIQFKDALQDSTIPILIQVMDWQRIPDSFKENINSHHEILWQSGTTESNPALLEA